MIRAAILGRFGHAYVALRALELKADAKLVAYAPVPPEESLSAFDGWRDKLGDARPYENYEELLDKEKPDLVQVSGAFYRNGEVAIAAAEHGVNVLVEKPIATDLALLARLKDAVDRSGVRLIAMLGSRLAPLFATTKKVVAAGDIGEPVEVFAQKSYKFGTTRPDFYRQRKTYGGTIPWVGIHALDWIHWILDDPYARVTARHSSFTLAAKGYPGCEEEASMLFDLRNGGAALVNADYLRPPAAASHGDDRIRISGTAGVVEAVANENRVTVINADGERTIPVAGGEGNIFASFVESLATGAEHPIKPLDSFRITEVALKAREAADTGQTISLLDSPYSLV